MNAPKLPFTHRFVDDVRLAAMHRISFCLGERYLCPDQGRNRAESISAGQKLFLPEGMATTENI